MANVVYADPFGSYNRGQDQGQQQAIGLATAQRLFRDSDREADFRKWYDPHLRKQTEMQENQMQMQASIEKAKYLARLAMSGDPKMLDLLQQHWLQATGQNINFKQQTPLESIMMIGNMTGLRPFDFIDPNVAVAEGRQRYNLEQTQNAAPQTDPLHDQFHNSFPRSAPQPAPAPEAQAKPMQATGTAPASQLSTQGAEQKIGPWAGPHPTGAFETYGGGGTVEHSYPPTGGGLETGTVAPGSAASTGTAQTYGMGNNQGMESYGSLPGQFQTMFDRGEGSPLVPPSDAQHYNPPQAPQAAPAPAAPGQSQPKAAPVSPKAPAAAKVASTVAGATPAAAATPQAGGMDLTTLLTKLGDVIHSHFTGAPAPAPGAPAAPEEFLGKPGEAFDKAKAGLNALAGNVGQGADYAKAGWDKLRNRAMQEWNYDVHGISPQPEQPGAVYRPGVLDEPALQGIAAGNQSQYAKNPYMPEPKKLFSQSPISEFGKEPHDEFTGFPNTVRDPAYPPAPNQNLQAADLRAPVDDVTYPSFRTVSNTFKSGDPSTDMREQFARAAQPAFRASDPNTDMRAQFTKVPRAPDPSTDMRAQFAAAAYGKPRAVSPKGTIQRIGPAPPPVQTGYNSEEVIRRQDELRKQQNAPKPLAGGVY